MPAAPGEEVMVAMHLLGAALHPGAECLGSTDVAETLELGSLSLLLDLFQMCPLHSAFRLLRDQSASFQRLHLNPHL